MTTRRPRPIRLMLLALPLLALPIWNYQMHAAQVEGYVSTSGVVVDHVPIKMRSGSMVYSAVIEYTAPNGQTLRLVDPVKRSWAESKGDAVPVLMDPAQPSNAVRGGLLGHWFSVTVTTGIVVVMFVVIGTISWFEYRPAWRRLAQAKRRR